MLLRLLLAAAFTAAVPLSAPAQSPAYPETHQGETIDDYHGVKVADPYRWLEDVDAEATHAWIDAQNRLTEAFLEEIPERRPLLERLTALWDYPKYGVPTGQGGRYFFSKNDGLQQQSVLYVQDSLTDPQPRVLIDPNTFSDDGTVALSMLSISEDGRLAAYGTSASGSDWQTFRVRDVATGEDLADALHWIKFSGAAWRPDGEGFYYGRYEAPEEGAAYEQVNKGQQLYYHHLGTSQDEDLLVYERPDDPELGFQPEVTHDGRYLVITVWKGTDRRTRLYYKDLHADGEVVRLLDAFDASYTFVGNTGDTFYLLTDRDAPNQRLVAVNLSDPAPEQWRTLIPESDAVLQGAHVIHDQFIVDALVDVKARLTRHNLDGSLVHEIALPTLGSVGALHGDPDDDEMFYAFTSFTYPTTVYRYDFDAGKSEVFRAPEVDFDAGQYETRQVFYTSKDGTRVPMFIVHKKGLKLDGSNPAYLYGYGGFNISLTPAFSVSNLVWLEQGGIFAMPNLRGGGEYGEAWHQAGMLEKKQNVFDDFIAAAEYLIAEGYTSTPRLAIGGGSNGGLLTGACLTQRPDLFGAVVVDVGVLDMLRFHQFTIGWAWVSEYGSSEDPEQFEYLYRYSPLHNIRPGTAYPATLITTADHDDRVVPGHSFKFAAALQAAQAGPAPVLIRVETKAGHGAGKPTDKIIEEEADVWAFLLRTLGVGDDAAGPLPNPATASPHAH